jgi:isopenicillin-N epimerase
MTNRFGRDMLAEWLLDPACTHLNHGTVSATPRRVLAAQRALSDEIERNPARFMLREIYVPSGAQVRGHGPPRLRAAATEVGAFFGARGEDCVFTDNASTGINAVLRSLDFRSGDEIVLLDHTYGAVLNTAEYIARRTGAVVRSARLQLPCPDPSAVVSAIAAELGPRTRIAIIDHITSRSALVLPLAEIAALCHRHDVAVLVDGAHVPGAIALDIPALGVDWYAGNLHKWAWAPRSSAILWVDRARQAELHPVTISWGLDQGMCQEFDWVGTRDPTPYLAATTALAWQKELGVAAVQSYNHALAWQAGGLLAEHWHTERAAPESMIGTMVCARLPETAGTTQAEGDRLRDVLLYEHAIEVAVIEVDGNLWVRVSAQIYNELADVEKLARAVSSCLHR